MQLHVFALAGLDTVAGYTNAGAVDEALGSGEDDPAGGGGANDLAQAELAVAFGEVFAVGEGRLVGDKHGGYAERALAKRLAAGRCGAVARRHEEVVATREDIDHAAVDVSAVVVPDIDHDAFLSLVLNVEIDIELREVVVAHGGDMHVAELAARDALHVSTALLDPTVVEQAGLDLQGHGADDCVTPLSCGLDAECDALADLVLEKGIEARVRCDGCSVHREQAISKMDGAFEGRGA